MIVFALSGYEADMRIRTKAVYSCIFKYFHALQPLRIFSPSVSIFTIKNATRIWGPGRSQGKTSRRSNVNCERHWVAIGMTGGGHKLLLFTLNL